MYVVTVMAVAYVIAAKRLSVVLDVMMGGLFFKEKEWRKVLMPTVIMLIGVFIILFQR